MSIYFHGYDYFINVSFLGFQEQAIVSVKRGYVWQEKSSISYTLMNFHFCYNSLTALMAKHSHRFHQKEIFCLFYRVQIHKSQIWKFWN